MKVRLNYGAVAPAVYGAMDALDHDMSSSRSTMTRCVQQATEGEHRW